MKTKTNFTWHRAYRTMWREVHKEVVKKYFMNTGFEKGNELIEDNFYKYCAFLFDFIKDKKELINN
jgi:hypothetical protein